MDLLERISAALQAGDDAEVAELTQQAIEEDLPAEQILGDGLIAGMNVVGDQFRAHEIFLPDVLLAARAMHAGMGLLEPLFLQEEIPSLGKVVVGTVQGDIHDIGKNLVAIMLRGGGFEVVDAGVDVPPARFVELVRETGADVVALSALLTTTMPSMKAVIDEFAAEGLRGKVKILIGGAPVTESYAREIGADGFARNASAAVATARKLIDPEA